MKITELEGKDLKEEVIAISTDDDEDDSDTEEGAEVEAPEDEEDVDDDEEEDDGDGNDSDDDGDDDDDEDEGVDDCVLVDWVFIFFPLLSSCFLSIGFLFLSSMAEFGEAVDLI
ncbi:unnamed protein product [Linum trigynum]|uniref:Uncharacterized protein n=1 Tax=Linum trigynum TaxID=586398 RepID=A0AAV2FE27_9ROSI